MPSEACGKNAAAKAIDPEMATASAVDSTVDETFDGPPLGADTAAQVAKRGDEGLDNDLVHLDEHRPQPEPPSLAGDEIDLGCRRRMGYLEIEPALDAHLLPRSRRLAVAIRQKPGRAATV